MAKSDRRREHAPLRGAGVSIAGAAAGGTQRRAPLCVAAKQPASAGRIGVDGCPPATVRLLVLLSGIICMSGCLERVIHVTTDPPGALVHLNDVEVGRTPVEVPFNDFGTYDVRIKLEGYEPIHTGAKASAPPWEWPGLDLAAMILPIPFKTEIRWHYELRESQHDEAALLHRARERRDAFRAELPPPASEDEVEASEAGGANDPR